MIRIARLATVWMLGAAGLISSASAHEPPELPKLIATAKPAVATIVTMDKTGARVAQGTGFFVAPGIMVTCSHVLDGAFAANAMLHDGTQVQVKFVMGEDEAADLALVGLGAIDKNQTTIVLTDGLPQEGARILVVGTPKGLECTATDGIVSSIRAESPLRERIQISAPISAGSSGSPVLNMKGEACGVAVSTVRDGQNLNFAIPAAEVKKIVLGTKPNASGSVGLSLEERWSKVAVEQFLTARRVVIECEARKSARVRDAAAFGEGDEIRKKESDELLAALAQIIRASRFRPADAEVWEYVGHARGVLPNPPTGDKEAWTQRANSIVEAYEKSLSIDRDQPEVWKEITTWYLWAGRLEDWTRAPHEGKLASLRLMERTITDKTDQAQAKLKAYIDEMRAVVEREMANDLKALKSKR